MQVSPIKEAQFHRLLYFVRVSCCDNLHLFCFSPSDCRKKSDGHSSSVVSSVSPASPSDVSTSVVIRPEVCTNTVLYSAIVRLLYTQGVLRKRNPHR